MLSGFLASTDQHLEKFSSFFPLLVKAYYCPYGVTSALEPFLHNPSVENPLQNLIMTILIAMTSPSIPEAFGHNKPLFIADKIAKYNYVEFKRIADSTATWLLNNHKLRKFIFYMSTFRERRSAIEATRRETP